MNAEPGRAAGLAGRRALVTGSTRGIGRAVARSLAGAGASVVAHGRARADAQRVAESLGDASLWACADLADPSQCARLARRAVDLLGGIDILVNNAGLRVFAPIGKLRPEDWRLQVDVNLGGVFHVAKAVVDRMMEQQSGDIINIGSLASRHAIPQGAGYNASKFGLLGLTEAMMLDLRPHGIRVGIVLPGSVNTRFFGSASAPEPWRLEPEDCAAAVLHMLSYPRRAHLSRIEIRPSNPPSR